MVATEGYLTIGAYQLFVEKINSKKYLETKEADLK